MWVGRAIGWGLIALAVAAAGHEAFASLQSGDYRLFSFGDMWASIDRFTLNIIAAWIQRHVWPWLWEGVILRGFLAPAWLVLLIPGIVLAFYFRDGYMRYRRYR